MGYRALTPAILDQAFLPCMPAAGVFSISVPASGLLHILFLCLAHISLGMCMAASFSFRSQLKASFEKIL